MTVLRRLRSLFIAASLALAGLAPAAALAQDANTRVIVPDVPGGAVFTGCYRATAAIYNGYRLSFCLTQRGSYQVTGRGVKCSGTLSWSANRATINVKLRRTSCGNGVAWSGDHMTCKPAGLISGIVGFVIAPNVPNLAALRCTYTPVAPGYRPTTIVARRYS